MIIRLAFQTAEKLEELEVAEKHMKEGMRQFENAAEDCSNVADTYLEPLRMDMDHMPDYARLDKPKRPPVPEVSPVRTFKPLSENVKCLSLGAVVVDKLGFGCEFQRCFRPPPSCPRRTA